MSNNYVVEGFSFYTEKDATLAAQEQKKVEYLEEKMDYNNLDTVQQLYQRLIQDRIFKTPVGTLYLKSLQQYLLAQEEIAPENVPPIPLYLTYDGEIREHANPARSRIQPSKKKKKKSIAFPVSVILNLALVAAVIAMFAITMYAPQPNILNYEKNLVNKYAAWEQELTEREQAVREKELEWKQTE